MWNILYKYDDLISLEVVLREFACPPFNRINRLDVEEEKLSVDEPFSDSDVNFVNYGKDGEIFMREEAYEALIPQHNSYKLPEITLDDLFKDFQFEPYKNSKENNTKIDGEEKTFTKPIMIDKLESKPRRYNPIVNHSKMMINWNDP